MRRMQTWDILFVIYQFLMLALSFVCKFHSLARLLSFMHQFFMQNFKNLTTTTTINPLQRLDSVSWLFNINAAILLDCCIYTLTTRIWASLQAAKYLITAVVFAAICLFGFFFVNVQCLLVFCTCLLYANYAMAVFLLWNYNFFFFWLLHSRHEAIGTLTGIYAYCCSYYYISLNLFSASGFPISYIAEFLSLVQNPLRDVDLTVNTDCEDLLVFMCDIIEFVEQDKAFLLDALFDSWFTLNWVTTVTAVATSLELVILLKLRQQTQTSLFLRKFNV